MDDSLISLACKAETLVRRTRVREVAWLIETDRQRNRACIAGILDELPSGAYLLGCGPYCTGLYPVSTDEVVLGRPASPLEKPAEQVADFTLNDAIWLVPREVSRIHATILTSHDTDGPRYSLRDEDSSTGTYLNGERLGEDNPAGSLPNPAPLDNSDVIGLGPTGINCYLFLVR